jgi:beta-lactamase regulating signal transducer with metallopeptidase domain
MESYLYTSTVISIMALVLIKYGKGSSNANYYLSSLAIVSWFIPYSYIAEFIPKDVLLEPYVFALSPLSVSRIVSSAQTPYFAPELWFKWGLWLLMCIGIFVFINRVIKFAKWNNHIRNNSSLTLLTQLSEKYQLPIYSAINVPSGLLLGIVNPVIIISKSITDPKHIALIVAHEKQHLVNNDNVRLVLLEIVECLFWWNPLVRKLISINRFFIEVRCDENTSKEYGYNNYINDLASLILLKDHNEPSNLVCTATSNNKNNIHRIKLLQEKRRMTLSKKLTYTLTLCITLISMSWNTLATATHSEQTQQTEVEQNKLGVLVDFETIVEKKIIGNITETHKNKMLIWTNFAEKVTIKVSDNFSVNFTAEDMGESVSLSYELIEATQTTTETIVEPKLTVDYGTEAIIEIDNPQLSEYAYLIKTTPSKSFHPSLGN